MPRLIPIALVTWGALALGCSSGAEDARGEPALGKAAQPIINGVASTTSQDFVVEVATLRGSTWEPTCTGTLVAKNLVITARHCVGQLEEVLERVTDHPPAKLGIFTGVDAPSKLRARGTPAARGAQLFVRGKSLTPDLAVLLLDTPLDNPIAPIRLGGGVAKGEQLDIVGYGLTERNTFPLARRQREDLVVAATEGESTDHFALLDGEFQFGEGACSGDSGGPALSATGALVGVATRVSNGRNVDPNHVSAICVGSSVEVVYTDLSPLQQEIETAFQTAGATPWLEGEPSPEEKAAAAEAAANQEQAARGRLLADGCSTSATGSRRGGAGAGALAASLALLGLVSARRRKALPANG